jgi:AraC-like DNA-binding protein
MKYLYIEGEWVNSLLNTFTELGLNLKTITQDLDGIENDRVFTNQRLEVSIVRKIWHRADRLAQDPLLGVKVGRLLNYRALGVLSPVIWHSPTIRDVIENIKKFQTLISESGRYHINQRLTDNEPSFYCEYVAAESSVPVNPHQILAVVAHTIELMAAITGNTFKINKLYVPKSLNAQLIANKLGIKVISHNGNFAICFPPDQIDKPFLGVDKNLYQINLAYAEELLRGKNTSVALINSVKDLIKEGGFSLANIEFVESSLSLNKRTFQRTLTQYGTSFRQLKEEVLKEEAVSLLLKQSIDMEELATYLGYSEPSAFYRAFKTWYKMTPKQFYKGYHY